MFASEVVDSVRIDTASRTSRRRRFIVYITLIPPTASEQTNQSAQRALRNRLDGDGRSQNSDICNFT